MKPLKAVLLIGLCMLCVPGLAQQDIQFTQYMYNTVILNPAYAGSRGHLSFNGVYRSQWVGLDGAPRTQSFSVNDYLGNKMGLGLSVLRDEIGPATETNVTGDFAYILDMDGDGTKLAFGIKAGLHFLDVDFDRLVIANPTETNVLQDINRISPQIGTGIYLFDTNWYLGVSTPNLLQTDHYDEVATSTASERMHIYAIAGYVFDLNPNLKFKPSVLFKMVSGAPLSTDIAANFLWYEKFTLGASYRWDSSVSALAGFQVSDQLMIGYAYDFDTTPLVRYNSGSHEIFLRFEIFSRIRGKVSPRFF